ncbi:MAG: ferritin-like domain-containing protein [Alphaproteobacteria bacterium]|nr:MAG: ferritin-like domain-containing protein [Alphaproteobacteria bacterium]
MQFRDLYTGAPRDQTLAVDASMQSLFDLDYGAEQGALVDLYAKGKARQWDAEARIDWSLELDPDNPQQLPELLFPLTGFAAYEKASASMRADMRRHHQAWMTSQFLHGEQGALLCAAKIVQSVPGMDAKLYAATQAVDEARHVEAYRRLQAKFGIAYPITDTLSTLVEQVLADRRWDMTYLGMQVVIEGLALAAFAGIRDYAQNPLARQVNAYVMEDEARHVAFGRLALREIYPQLLASERREREDFLIEACHLMRERFFAAEVWRHFGLPLDACRAFIQDSPTMANFRTRLFSRIVPVVRDIGLMGPRVAQAFEAMGVRDFAAIDLAAVAADDEAHAAAIDARRAHITAVAGLAE